MNISEARDIVGAMKKHLALLEDDLGVTFTFGSFTYGGGKVSLKVDAATLTEVDGTSVPADFAAACNLVGLEPSDYGRTFTSRGRQYKVTGINLRRRKYPVSAERDDGRGFKFDSETVVRNLRAGGA